MVVDYEGDHGGVLVNVDRRDCGLIEVGRIGSGEDLVDHLEVGVGGVGIETSIRGWRDYLGEAGRKEEESEEKRDERKTHIRISFN